MVHGRLCRLEGLPVIGDDERDGRILCIQLASRERTYDGGDVGKCNIRARLI